MFHSTYLQSENSLNQSPHKQLNLYHNHTSDMDLMYELYSKYMNVAREEIAVKEMMLMNDSQVLIQMMMQNNRISLNKDVASTIDSFSIDEEFDSSIMQDFSSVERPSLRKITRKGGRIPKMLKSSQINQDESEQIMRQIEEKCSQKTYEKIKMMMNQYRKNHSKIIEIQNKQKKLNKFQQRSDKIQQDNVLLKTQLQDIQSRLRLKDEEIRELKEKVCQLKMQQKENILPITNSKEFIQAQNVKNASQKQIIAYVNEKQSITNKRLKKIQEIQKNIENTIQLSILQNKNTDECTNCCSMISRIKKSIVEYRGYLEDEGFEYEKLFIILRKQIQRSCVQLGEQKMLINQ